MRQRFWQMVWASGLFLGLLLAACTPALVADLPPTAPPSLTFTATSTPTQTFTATAAQTATPSVTPTITPTPTPTFDDVYAGVDPSGQVVRFWHNHTSVRRTALLEIVADFNRTNPYNITVQPIYAGGYTAIFNQLLPTLNTANVPSLTVAYQNQAATYQLVEGLVDMTALVNSPTWGLTPAEQADFFPAFFDSDVFPMFAGQRLGLAPNRSMEVLFYNADWLAELGANGPPTHPDDFRQLACLAAEQPFSRARSTTSRGYEVYLEASIFASWTFAFGGDIFDTAAEEFTYDSPAAVAAMTFLQELVQGNCATIVQRTFGDQTNFGLGTTLFTVGSSAGLPFYQRAVRDGSQHAWNVAALPHTTADPVMNIYGASVSIPRTTPAQELAAWLFVKHYTQPEVQARWGLASNYFPVRVSAANSPEIQAEFAANPAYQTAFDLLPYGKTEPPVPGYDFVRALVVEAMREIMNGAPVETTLEQLNTQANDILAEQLAQRTR